MRIRIASGIVGAGLYLSLLFTNYVHGLPFALAVALFSCLGFNELYRAVRRQGYEPNEVGGYIACVAFQLAAWAYSGAQFAPYLPALLLLLVMATLLAEVVKGRSSPIINVGTTLLGAVYVGWLSSYLMVLRGLDRHIATPPIVGTTPGEWIVLFVTATTWASDTGALFFGTALGRRKLAPSVSPAKTWEGSVGGVATALALGAALGAWIHLPMGHALGLSLLCAVAGQVGDLCESVLKRDLGVKDFGTVMPGHGGVLDRIDSVLFSAPLAYYYLLFFLAR